MKKLITAVLGLGILFSAAANAVESSDVCSVMIDRAATASDVIEADAYSSAATIGILKAMNKVGTGENYDMTAVGTYFSEKCSQYPSLSYDDVMKAYILDSMMD